MGQLTISRPDAMWTKASKGIYSVVTHGGIKRKYVVQSPKKGAEMKKECTIVVSKMVLW